MDAIFINANPSGMGMNEATVSPSLGFAYIAAVLEQDDFECKIIDANLLRLPDNKVLEKISINVKLIGFYLYSFNYTSVKNLASKAKEKHPDSLILLGGPAASAIEPGDLLSDITADGIVRGEGEYSVLQIMRNIRNGKPPFEGDISGLAYLDSEQNIVINPVQRIKDLDVLPFPAFHLLPPLKTFRTPSRKSPVAPMITSRGCVFGCSFCSKDIFQRTVTFRSAENVLSEIDFLVNNYGVRQIDILDDNFAQRRSRFMDILDGIIERNYNIALNFQSGVRTENLDEDVLEKMKKAGVYSLAFGIESADEDVLKLHNKKLSLNKAEEIIRAAKKRGFTTKGFFIIGLPGETEEGFNKTIAFAKRMDFDIASFSMAIPFINTDLYKMVATGGHFLIDTRKNIDVGFYGANVFFEYKNMKKEDVLRRYKAAYKEFYSFGKRLRMLLTVRSWNQFKWYIVAYINIIENLIRRS